MMFYYPKRLSMTMTFITLCNQMFDKCKVKDVSICTNKSSREDTFLPGLMTVCTGTSPTFPFH